MKRDSSEQLVDCEAGRRMGCATFCCRLIVRYDPGEVVRSPEGVRKHCVDKDPDTGLCVNLDAATGRCRIWERRPSVCRAYDCNADPSLQVVLREGFRSLVALALSPTVVPRDWWIPVPTLDGDDDPC